MTKSKENVGEKVWDRYETRFKEGKITELDRRILSVSSSEPPLPLSERGKYWKAKGDELWRMLGAVTRDLTGQPSRKKQKKRRAEEKEEGTREEG